MLNRRRFLETAAGVSALAGAGRAATRSRKFEVTTRIEVLNASGPTRVWAPVALERATPWQRTLANRVDCKGGAVKTEASAGGSSPRMIAAEFPAGVKPVLSIAATVETRDWTVNVGSGDLRRGGAARVARPANVGEYLRPTKYIPTGGIVKQTADEITRGAATDVEKARAIYEWIVENTRRNPKTRGCGLGDIRFMLESGDLSGKCADLNALYVGLARAAGLAARDVYGIRIAKSELGYKSLGTSTSTVTTAQHCRAEVWLDGYGWTPVDPADVRKVMLEEPPAGRSAADPLVESARRRLFGSWEMNWMAYNFAHDVMLPGSRGPALPFLMYPQAEVAGQRIDCLDPANFRYEITAKEITV